MKYRTIISILVFACGIYSCSNFQRKSIPQNDTIIRSIRNSYDSLRVCTYDEYYTADYVFYFPDTDSFIEGMDGAWARITDTLLLSTLYRKTQEIKLAKQDTTINEKVFPSTVAILSYDNLADTLSANEYGEVLLKDGYQNVYTVKNKDIYYLLFYACISQGPQWWNEYEKSAFKKFHNSSLESLIRPLME